jgi:hypothetical protein
MGQNLEHSRLPTLLVSSVYAYLSCAAAVDRSRSALGNSADSRSKKVKSLKNFDFLCRSTILKFAVNSFNSFLIGIFWPPTPS